jgi:predicted DNA-binding protein
MAVEKMEQVLVRMPPDLHRRLKERAAEDERTMAQAVRYAVRLYLGTD